MANAWHNFTPGKWRDAIDVRDFIQTNYTPYTGGADFLRPPTSRTEKLNAKYMELAAEERARGGVLDIDTNEVSSLLSYPAGYLDRDDELIVGFQTGSPLRRGINPFGGMRMVEQSCAAYGYELPDKIREYFKYRTTHNDGVFRIYTDEMKAARHSGVITGLPDAYGRGRIIGDYRRVALYGADRLIAEKEKDMQALARKPMTPDVMQLREDVFRQIDFLKKLKEMAALYGVDVGAPAQNAREAAQWVYFGYLGAVKEQNGAAMSLGRVSAFLDIYFERDLAAGLLDEDGAQEIIDQFVLKLRMTRQLRTPDYNEMFAGDPTWVTESLGGAGEDGRTLVTKTAFRMLRTLYNLKPSPEPNLTVLWSASLPEPFKKFCARVSIDTDSLQYENDDLMRPLYGDDYAIACCVSAMRIGKEMQFFGARSNLPKVLLYTLNDGRDEISGKKIADVPGAETFMAAQSPFVPPCHASPAKENCPAENAGDGKADGETEDKENAGDGKGLFIDDAPLNYAKVMRNFKKYIDWLCKLYVNTMNVIHYSHDKYAYEKIQMALHDTEVHRYMAFGAAGLSVAADSLSAIKYARVRPIRGADGITRDFLVEGDFPKFGNDDPRADKVASDLAAVFIRSLRKNKTYKNAEHTLSLLTITANVAYGKKTGATPDGRKCGEPFAPGANPMHGRDASGALAALNSVAGIDFCACRDGISNTFSIVPAALGRGEGDRIDNLAALLDGYFAKKAHHLNVNVLNREKLEDAMANPDKYPLLTVRVSGYAVRFNSLTREQQKEVIVRTFHKKL